MGPGGRCLLLNIDNNWSIDENYIIYYQSENQMFTDAIGTRSIIRSYKDNDTQKYINTEKYTIGTPDNAE